MGKRFWHGGEQFFLNILMSKTHLLIYLLQAEIMHTIDLELENKMYY